MHTVRICAVGATVLLGLALSAGTARAQDKKQVERGVELYTTHKCQLCHSVGGKGAKKGPLDGVGDKLSEEEIRLWLVDPQTMAKKTNSTRKPLKKSYANLPKEDLDALVAYMKSLKK